MLTCVVQEAEEQEFWQEFLDYWRHKTPEDFAPNKIIDLSMWMDIWGSWPMLEETNGRLYVREEYVIMYLRLVAASESADPKYPGAVITGQPGIGEYTSVRNNRSTHIVRRQVVFRYLRSTSAHLGVSRRYLCTRYADTRPLPRQRRLPHHRRGHHGSGSYTPRQSLDAAMGTHRTRLGQGRHPLQPSPFFGLPRGVHIAQRREAEPSGQCVWS